LTRIDTVRGLAVGATLVATFMLAACVTSQPVAMVLPSGQVLRGNSAATASGSFSVRNEKMSCSGTFSRSVSGYNVSLGRHTSVFAACSNGQNATSAEPLWEAGQAKLRFTDGSEGTMLIGDAAKDAQELPPQRKAR
jgi:hypothetical protein